MSRVTASLCLFVSVNQHTATLSPAITKITQLLIKHGVLSSKLLPILWGSDVYKGHIDELKHLVCKYGIMIPLVKEDVDEEQKYLVPAILTLLSSADRPSRASDASSLCCQIVFAPKAVAADWLRHGAMSVKDVETYGFLPHGVFPQIVGVAVSQCEQFYHDRMDITSLQLSSSHADGLAFGEHRFSLEERLIENTIDVRIKSQKSLTVVETLHSLVTEMLKTSTGLRELEAVFAVRTRDGSSYCVIFGEHGLHSRVAQQRIAPGLLQGGLEKSGQSLREMFREWLPPKGLLPAFDVFVSYR